MYAMLLLSTCGSAAVRCWVAREMSSRASAARSSDCWIGSGFAPGEVKGEAGVC